MTALEYVMPQSEFYQYDYEDYCWVEEACLSLFKNDKHRNDLLFYSRCELFTAFTNDLCGSYLMNKETMDKLKAIEIYFDKGTEDWEGCTRRPYYRIRGKKVTEEQAAQIIEATPEYYDDEEDDKIYLININHLVKSDGTVGVNSITSKYPDINEMLQDILQLKIRFPYLDFVMAISWWNEVSPEAYENDIFENTYINGKLHEYKNFSKNIDIAIWVHDNKIDILNEDNGQEKYEEYDKLYSDENLSKYLPHIYNI